MNYHLLSAKISSPSSEKYWGGCFVEEDLIVLLEIESDGSVFASRLGKSLFDSIIRLKNQESRRDKNTLKTLLKEISKNTFVKTVLIGILSDSDLFLGCHGKGQAVLVRGSQVGTVVSGGFISRGTVGLNDRIIFHSDRLAQILGTEFLEKIYHAPSLEVFEEELAGVLTSNEKAEGISVLEVILAKKKFFSEINNINTITRYSLKKYFPLYLLNWLKLLRAYYFKKTFRQKVFLLAVFVLLIFFVIKTFTGFVKSGNSQKLLKLNESLRIVESQFEEAQNIIELNPVRSRELLGMAKLSVSQLLSKAKKNSSEYNNLNIWHEKIALAEVAAFKIYKLTAVPVFFDITLIKPGGQIDAVASYQNSQVILDRQNKTVYYLDVSTKQSSLIAGDSVVKDAAVIAIHGTYAYILNSEGIFKIDIEKKTSGKVIERDENWGEISALQSFAANLYLLDVKNNSIWKYIAADSGFSDRKSYLQSGIGVSLTGKNALAIDGSVWVLGGSDILKFTAGGNDQFSFKGLSDSISNIDSFSTSDTDRYIYLLDRSLKRILVFDKDGLYYSQYQWDELSKARLIIASELTSEIYVYIDNKIYAIDIK